MGTLAAGDHEVARKKSHCRTCRTDGGLARRLAWFRLSNHGTCRSGSDPVDLRHEAFRGRLTGPCAVGSVLRSVVERFSVEEGASTAYCTAYAVCRSRPASLTALFRRGHPRLSSTSPSPHRDVGTSTTAPCGAPRSRCGRVERRAVGPRLCIPFLPIRARPMAYGGAGPVKSYPYPDTGNTG